MQFSSTSRKDKKKKTKEGHCTHNVTTTFACGVANEVGVLSFLRNQVLFSCADNITIACTMGNLKKEIELEKKHHLEGGDGPAKPQVSDHWEEKCFH